MGKSHILLIVCLLALRLGLHAQETYRYVQTFDHEISVLVVNAGWDAQFIQEPSGTESQVVFITHCPDFFEEGEQPHLVEFPVEGEMILRENRLMPRKTVVEIHIAKPLRNIILSPDARLSIGNYDAGQTPLSVDVQDNAQLSIGRLTSQTKVTFVTRGASTLTWNSITAQKLTLWTSPRSQVNEGAAQVGEFNRHGLTEIKEKIGLNSDKHSPDTIPWYNRGFFRFLDANIGIGFSSTFGNIDLTSLASPYKVANATTYMLQVTTRDLHVRRFLAFRAGISLTYSRQRLKNSVCVVDRLLVIDTTAAGITHQQFLNTLSVGVPLTVAFTPHASFWKDFAGVSLSLTPMYVHNRRLRSRKMNEDGKWRRSSDRINIFRPFNLRGSIGLHLHISPSHTLHLEFSLDLLPTFQDATKTKFIHHFGISFAL